jgi:hypothetical protein
LEEHIASIFRVEEIISARTSKQAGGKMTLFITTAVKTSNPTTFKKVTDQVFFYAKPRTDTRVGCVPPVK